MSPFSNSEMSPFFEVQSRTRSPRFDIAPRTGDWTRDGSHWVDRPGRAAQIYVFAWHGESRAELCDQSNAEQWLFYVVREECLPVGQKSIALGTAAGGRAYSGKRRSSPTRNVWPDTPYIHFGDEIAFVVAGLFQGDGDRLSIA